MPWSDYIKTKVQDWLHGGGAYTPSATTYFAAMLTAPTSAGGGVEASITRVAFTNNNVNWDAYDLTNGKRNAVIIDFGIVSSTTTVADIAEYDAAAAGNLLTFDNTSGPVTVNAGGKLVVAVHAAVLKTN